MEKHEVDAKVINNTEVGAVMIKFLEGVSAQELENLLVGKGLLDEEDKKLGYGTMIMDQDVNAVAYILAAMARKLTPAVLNEFSVIEGFYDKMEHTWITFKGSIIGIDPTLAQFKEDVPKISIVNLEESSSYEWAEENVMDAEYWLSETSGIDIDISPTLEDWENVAQVVEEEREAKRTKEYKYQIGEGSYSFDNEPTPLDIFLCVLEEYELNLEKEAIDMMPIEYQDMAYSLDKAIKHTTNLLDKKFLEQQGTGHV